MKKSEVAKLYKEIKEEYANFDASIEAVEKGFKMLKDIPYEIATINVKQHFLTNIFPPKFPQIRGRFDEQLDRQHMKELTQVQLDKQAQWEKEACPPPEGMKEALYAKLYRAERH
ncbi:hypothetical protein [Paenibacillus pini]|uniref:Replicative helicase inhibitor G39P N-terminal domain-containing protein n=1 Tax=Paenibacillus pini JCM 16418 TaxID=1236976 RepID=W7YQD1_9BACL|nr:hypothetical protein [Paenibacillus pini]GAF06796.1 hypothetical protein JCM16418_778 [Paenibacillus pini JCM 16418]